ISELDGMFTAIVSGPVPVMPSQWLPHVWGDFEPQWGSEEDFSKVMSLMVRHFNEIASTLLDSPDDFDPIFLERTVDGKHYTIVDEWCQGYMRGVSMSVDLWDDGGQEVTQMLLPIMMFTSQKGWEMLDNMADEEVEQMQQAIPGCAQDIYAWWLEKRGGDMGDEFDEDSFPYVGAGEFPVMSMPFVKENEDVGRNDPCPCGSGKKFKKCCLH
ncbi:MAG: UPF0149 family protein, partial [Gammaproteobacteria bacterium]|nr:UPF0149 family protein [Gammaproteobacteria bacterium]